MAYGALSIEIPGEYHSNGWQWSSSDSPWRKRARRKAQMNPMGGNIIKIASLLFFLWTLGLFLWVTTSPRTSVPEIDAAERAEYILVFDCGSTGTRLNLIRKSPDSTRGGERYETADWHSFGVDRPASLPEHLGYDRLEVLGGIHDLALASESEVAGSLEPLLRWAAQVIPPRQHRATPVLLFATAGVRGLPSEHQRQLMGRVRSVLGHSGFLFSPTWAEVITGEQEGGFSWTSINYKLGRLGDPASARVGGKQLGGSPLNVADLGGSSIQFSFSGEQRDLARGGGSGAGPAAPGFNVSAVSFPNLGMNGAFKASLERLAETSSADEGSIEHPCLQRGYDTDHGGIKFVGAFDLVRCKELIDDMPQVDVLRRFDWRSRSQGEDFVMLSGFYLIHEFFRVSMASPWSDLVAEAMRVCSAPFHELTEAQLGHSNAGLSCFRAAYTSYIVSDWMDLSDAHVRVSKESDWSLGAALWKSEDLRSAAERLPTEGGGGGSWASRHRAMLLGLFAAANAAGVLALVLKRRREMNHKPTIIDLENGSMRGIRRIASFNTGKLSKGPLSS